MKCGSFFKRKNNKYYYEVFFFTYDIILNEGKGTSGAIPF
jgi:hypothetical protein